MLKRISLLFKSCLVLFIFLIVATLGGGAYIYHSAVSWWNGTEQIEKLSEYAKEVPQNTEATKEVTNFTKHFYSNSPIRRLKMVYFYLKSEWKYIPDPKGQDHFRDVSTILSTKKYEGDCEDFSGVIMAVCNSMKIESYICLGENGNRGHTWLEVKIDSSSLNTIKSEFGNDSKVVERNSDLWLQLNSTDIEINDYEPKYCISRTGQVYDYIQQ